MARSMSGLAYLEIFTVRGFKGEFSSCQAGMSVSFHETRICGGLDEVGRLVAPERGQLEPPVLAVVGHTVNGAYESRGFGFHGRGVFRGCWIAG